LDEREQGEWKAGIQAGNLYINRGTTGAIVLRQPFGGMGKSAVGTGLKAGGPNYVAQFLHFEERRDGDAPDHPLSHRDLESMRIALRLVIQRTNPQPHIDKLRSAASDVLRALASYDHAWSTEFGRHHDHFHLLGQDNIRRYLPFREIRVRVTQGDSFFDTFARVAAARATGARVIASHLPGGGSAITRLLDDLTDAWAGGIEFVEESDAELADSIRYAPAHSLERIRFATRKSVPAVIRQAAATAGQYIADEPVLAVGRIELLWYLREQSISHDYHRYGNLGARGEESRLPEHHLAH
jgi:RHH-type proline utilization regulon transcriptional repressor/proline dehydrogenase/delta 1-pyrroline-5-carboxylate dehydrogenase